MNNGGLWAAVFFTLLISACSKSSIPLTSFQGDTTLQAKALAQFKVNEIDFTYLHFKAKVDYVNGAESQNFSVNGRMKKDSILWLSITPGLGIEAVRCLILKDSVLVLDRIHNKLHSYGFSYINTMFNTNLTFGSLQAMLLGNLVEPKKAADKVLSHQSVENVILRQVRNNIQIDNYVSSKTFKVENFDMLNLKDENRLSIAYTDFAPLDTFLFAHRMKAFVDFQDENNKPRKVQLEIHHTKAELHSKSLNFPFNVPKRFEEK